jgi:cell division protein FtsN
VARDYAKSRNPSSGRSATARKAKKPKGGGAPGWLYGLVFGLAIGLSAAAYVWLSHPAHGAASAEPAQQTARAEPPKTIPLPPKQPSRFAFYELLPSYEVVIPREDAAASTKAGQPTTPEIAAPGEYLIQVSAYKTRDEAERGRANLALLGVESKVEQVTIDQTQTWYRVRIGPESNLAHAQEILQRLDDNGIKGMLVKVKSG